jgi:hypothetical protein
VWSACGDDRPLYFEGVSEFGETGREVVRVITRDPTHPALGVKIRDLGEDEVRAFRQRASQSA